MVGDKWWWWGGGGDLQIMGGVGQNGGGWVGFFQ